MSIVSLSDMVNIALSAHEAVSVSFFALHTLMNGIIYKLKINDAPIEISAEPQLMNVVEEILRHVQERVGTDVQQGLVKGQDVGDVDKSKADVEGDCLHAGLFAKNAGMGDHPVNRIVAAAEADRAWKWEDRPIRSMYGGGRRRPSDSRKMSFSSSVQDAKAFTEDVELQKEKEEQSQRTNVEKSIIQAPREEGKGMKPITGQKQTDTGKPDDHDEEMMSDSDQEEEENRKGSDEDDKERGTTGGGAKARGTGDESEEMTLDDFVCNVVAVADIEQSFFHKTLLPQRGHLLTGAVGLAERTTTIVKEDLSDNFPVFTLNGTATKPQFEKCIRDATRCYPSILMVPDVDKMKAELSRNLKDFATRVFSEGLNIQIICSATALDEVHYGLKQLLTIQQIYCPDVTQVKVNSVKELKAGDQIAHPTAHLPLSQHHAIIRKIKTRQQLELIHHCSEPDYQLGSTSSKLDATIRVDVIDVHDYIRKGVLFLVKHCDANNTIRPELVIGRAESQIGKRGLHGRKYNIFSNNCETFANFCSTGKAFSIQSGY